MSTWRPRYILHIQLQRFVVVLYSVCTLSPQALYDEFRKKILQGIKDGLLRESDFDFIFRDHIRNMLMQDLMERNRQNNEVRQKKNPAKRANFCNKICGPTCVYFHPKRPGPPTTSALDPGTGCGHCTQRGGWCQLFYSWIGRVVGPSGAWVRTGMQVFMHVPLTFPL